MKDRGRVRARVRATGRVRVRYAVACTQLRDFMQPATDQYATYLNKGYNRRTAKKSFEMLVTVTILTVKYPL